MIKGQFGNEKISNILLIWTKYLVLSTYIYNNAVVRLPAGRKDFTRSNPVKKHSVDFILSSCLVPWDKYTVGARLLRSHPSSTTSGSWARSHFRDARDVTCSRSRCHWRPALAGREKYEHMQQHWTPLRAIKGIQCYTHWLTSAQVVVQCLAAPSHWLNWYELINGIVAFFTKIAHNINH